MSNWIQGFVLLDTETGKKYHIPMEAEAMANYGNTEHEVIVQLYEILDPRHLEEVDEDE